MYIDVYQQSHNRAAADNDDVIKEKRLCHLCTSIAYTNGSQKQIEPVGIQWFPQNFFLNSQWSFYLMRPLQKKKQQLNKISNTTYT